MSIPLSMLLVAFTCPQAALVQIRQSGPDHLQGGACHAIPQSSALADSLAQQYAPVFLYSPFERYFPTLPYFTAFDGRDQHLAKGDTGLAKGDPGVDFADLDEIAPLAADSSGRADWSALDTIYQGRSRNARPSQSVVFYQVRSASTDDIKRIRTYLRSDRQAWNRLNPGSLPFYIETLEQCRPEKGKCSKEHEGRFVVVPVNSTNRDSASATLFELWAVQYYMYYLNDFGLQGHPYDIEAVFIFVPKDTAWARRFRIDVGAGHLKLIPNNVLLLDGGFAESNPRPHIMVELGDHSNAPDVTPHGIFQQNVDANWHTENLWGVRDVQAASGQGWFGQYRPSMTFQRDSTFSVRLYPPGHDSVISIIRGVESFTPGDFRDPSDSLRRQPPSYSYSLVPVSTLQCLYREINATESIDDQRQHVATILDSLGSELGAAWGPLNFRQLPVAQQKLALERMLVWHHDFVKDGDSKPAEKVRIWESPHVQEPPSRIFKLGAFAPNFRLGELVQVWRPVVRLFRPDRWNFSLHLEEKMVRVGISSVTSLNNEVLHLPGFIEFQAGIGGFRYSNLRIWDWKPRWSPFASLLFERSYSYPFSWYAGFSYVARRGALFREITTASDTLEVEGQNFVVKFGATILPTAVMEWFPFRIRAGVKVDVGAELLTRTAFEFALSPAVFR